MATIKKWLDAAGFDWDTGRILVQFTDGDVAPGWSYEPDFLSIAYVSKDHPILSQKFESGYGAPQCPRFIAEDNRAFYFPYQYDGVTGPVVVMKNLDHYLIPANLTPYPGG